MGAGGTRLIKIPVAQKNAPNTEYTCKTGFLQLEDLIFDHPSTGMNLFFGNLCAGIRDGMAFRLG